MRAAQVVLGTIAVLIALSAALTYFRERTLVNFNPVEQIVLGAVLGAYVYKKEIDQKKREKMQNPDE